MQNLSTCLWFDSQAEEAANFYARIFSARGVKTEVMGKDYYPKASEEVSGKSKGSVMTVPFKIGDMEFLGLNGGPQFKFSESVSFIITCDDQAEVDYYWNALTADGGAESQCGWLKDKFGVSWQVVPKQFNAVMAKNPEKVMAALLEMKKIVLKELEDAANG